MAGEINNKIGVTFFCVFKNFKAAQQLSTDCIKIINPMQNNDFVTHFLGIEGNFTCIDCRACPHGFMESWI